jgi:hypothetical protein
MLNDQPDRWISFDARKKRSVVANAAIARELVGWYPNPAVCRAVCRDPWCRGRR